MAARAGNSVMIHGKIQKPSILQWDDRCNRLTIGRYLSVSVARQGIGFSPRRDINGRNCLGVGVGGSAYHARIAKVISVAFAPAADDPIQGWYTGRTPATPATTANRRNKPFRSYLMKILMKILNFA
jgi:hypothetical protein